MSKTDVDKKECGGEEVAEEVAEEEEEGKEEEEEEEEVKAKFNTMQKVYALDAPTGMLYEAIIRKKQFGPKSQQVNVLLLPDDESQQSKEEETVTFTWHYFVHYQGWNVRWDRWVAEDDLYVHVQETRILADKLKQEAKLLREAQKKKGKNREVLVSKIQKQMSSLTKEHRNKHSQTVNNNHHNNKDSETLVTASSEDPTEQSSSNQKQKQKQKTATKGGNKKNKTHNQDKKTTKNIKSKERKWTKAALQKERNLREKELETIRNRSHAEKINIPFGLKKELVDEWEIISQCDMVHNLPASVTVLDALTEYKQCKIDIIRSANPENSSTNTNTPITTSTSTSISSNTSSSSSSLTKSKKISNDDELQWEDMVESITTFFDEALPIHLLYRQEHAQCSIMKLQPSSSNTPNPKERYCQIYGCEYLLRLIVRFPSLLMESDIEESEVNKILFKIGDLVRFLQKHQSRFFLQSYRRKIEAEQLEEKRLVDQDENNTKAARVMMTTGTKTKSGAKKAEHERKVTKVVPKAKQTLNDTVDSDDSDTPISALAARKKSNKRSKLSTKRNNKKSSSRKKRKL